MIGVLQFHLVDPSAGSSLSATSTTAAFLSRIFGLIECYKAELNINAYYISQTTLEQVFVNLVRLQKEPDEPVPDGVLSTACHCCLQAFWPNCCGRARGRCSQYRCCCRRKYRPEVDDGGVGGSEDADADDSSIHMLL
ncbi:unnamed protein product [Dibothriocephalus latus]|uniref:Uncharacterized protein n=1 Tax=Dibothriocephalus latus TaxID=60516 RepID=A0A3P7LRS9_DIBLA|nr:unnamed protein product [Dibothriocephalus latus]